MGENLLKGELFGAELLCEIELPLFISSWGLRLVTLVPFETGYSVSHTVRSARLVEHR